MHTNRHGWTTDEAEWRDEVASDDEPFDQTNPDVDAFIDDMREMVRTVIECTTEPLRMFAEGFPRAFAYERKEWQGAWQRHGRSGWRQARHFWRASSRRAPSCDS